MHVLERLGVVEVKEDIRPQDGSHDRADAIEGLGDVDSDLGVLGWTADCNKFSSAFHLHIWWPVISAEEDIEPTGDVRVGSCLERS